MSLSPHIIRSSLIWTFFNFFFIRNVAISLICLKRQYILSQSGLNRCRVILNPCYKCFQAFGILWQEMGWFISISSNVRELYRPEILKPQEAWWDDILYSCWWCDGSRESPVKHLWVGLESTSRIPMSQAKSIPSSMAFASASNGPSGTYSFLLIAATHCPIWSWATTPTPIASRCSKMAPSSFTLYQGLCGGAQVVCLATFGIIILWFASWSLQQNVFLVTKISEEMFFITKNTALVTKYEFHH